jgi:hypothetical protein
MKKNMSGLFLAASNQTLQGMSNTIGGTSSTTNLAAPGSHNKSISILNQQPSFSNSSKAAQSNAINYSLQSNHP